MNNNLKDMAGKKIGEWTVLCRGEDAPRNRTRWICLCSCGAEKLVLGQNIRNGTSTNCGHLKVIKTRNRFVKHDMCRSSEYGIWSGIKRRCRCKSSKAYQFYGGRGIDVCDRWFYSFENFLEDMGKRPSTRHSVDRIDNDGNYEPSNCRWVIQSVQNLNRPAAGVRKRKNRYSARIKINGKEKALGTFATWEEAREVYLKAKEDLLQKWKHE